MSGMDNLELVDADGDTLHVRDADGRVNVSGYLLAATEVRNLHRYLSEWLDWLDAPAKPTPLHVVGEQPQTILEEAQDAVYGDRQQDYGHPREDFTRTAIIWTGLLHHKLADGEHLEAADIARCQIGVKLARDVHAPKRDNRVDMAGYALTLDRLETGR